MVEERLFSLNQQVISPYTLLLHYIAALECNTILTNRQTRLEKE